MNTLVKTRRPLNRIPSFFEDFLSDHNFHSNAVLSDTRPAVNVAENKEAFEIEMAVPGLNKEDFHINIEGKTLWVSAESKDEKNEEKENYSRKEFNYNSFKRSFGIPKFADTEKIEAVYENGILHLTIPKKEEAKPKEPQLIEVR